jgi:hypothetical protein
MVDFTTMGYITAIVFVIDLGVVCVDYIRTCCIPAGISINIVATFYLFSYWTDEDKYIEWYQSSTAYKFNAICLGFSILVFFVYGECNFEKVKRIGPYEIGFKEFHVGKT